MGSGEHAPCVRFRVIAGVWMVVEPLAVIALLVGGVAGMLKLTASFPDSRALAAVSVPVALAYACWLLSLRLELRARAQEYALIEVYLRVKGDLARAFPLRMPRAHERVEARTPLLRLAVQDFLQMARETPCVHTRIASAWVALVLALATVGDWAWHRAAHESAFGPLVAAAMVPCLALFAVAWSDLRRGRVRSQGDLRQVRAWAEGYRPLSEPMVLPSVIVLALLGVPAGLMGASWAARWSWTARLGVTEAMFATWLLAWRARGMIAGESFRRVERLAAPLDELLRCGLATAWDVLSCVCRCSGWGSAVLLALGLSWPASPRSEVASTLTTISAWLLTVSLVLGLLVLSHWRRPVTPVTCSARHLLGKQGETQLRRISRFLNVGNCASLLLLIVVAGLT
jgi:hypothetical protein